MEILALTSTLPSVGVLLAAVGVIAALLALRVVLARDGLKPKERLVGMIIALGALAFMAYALYDQLKYGNGGT